MGPLLKDNCISIDGQESTSLKAMGATTKFTYARTTFCVKNDINFVGKGQLLLLSEKGGWGVGVLDISEVLVKY